MDMDSHLFVPWLICNHPSFKSASSLKLPSLVKVPSDLCCRVACPDVHHQVSKVGPACWRLRASSRDVPGPSHETTIASRLCIQTTQRRNPILHLFHSVLCNVVPGHCCTWLSLDLMRRLAKSERGRSSRFIFVNGGLFPDETFIQQPYCMYLHVSSGSFFIPFSVFAPSLKHGFTAECTITRQKMFLSTFWCSRAACGDSRSQFKLPSLFFLQM